VYGGIKVSALTLKIDELNMFLKNDVHGGREAGGNRGVA